jgi:hypothetical protein
MVSLPRRPQLNNHGHESFKTYTKYVLEGAQKPCKTSWFLYVPPALTYNMLVIYKVWTWNFTETQHHCLKIYYMWHTEYSMKCFMIHSSVKRKSQFCDNMAIISSASSVLRLMLLCMYREVEHMYLGNRLHPPLAWFQ